MLADSPFGGHSKLPEGDAVIHELPPMYGLRCGSALGRFAAESHNTQMGMRTVIVTYR
jgi:hypothetical protein